MRFKENNMNFYSLAAVCAAGLLATACSAPPRDPNHAVPRYVADPRIDRPFYNDDRDLYDNRYADRYNYYRD